MSDAEFRRIPPDRLDEYQRIVDYAFRPEEGAPGETAPDAAGTDDATDLLERPGERFAVFADGDLRSVCKHYDFTARVRGEWAPLAGLASVATPPEHRRQGYVRRLIRGSLHRWRGDVPLAALWPFSRPYYRQFGWETANTLVKYTLPTDALSVARERRRARDPDGDWTVRRVTADEHADLQDAHEAYAADRGLVLRRDEEWWRKRVFQTLGDERPHVYACERDGEVRGHVVYTFEKTGSALDARRLTVSEMAYADHEARLALLGFLADHDSQAEESVYHGGDVSLLDVVDDPSDVRCEVRAGPMVRVVDVADALETTPYPADATADLTLAVSDDTAPWNDDTFRLQVGGGTGSCEPAAVTSAKADATVGIGTLSQLVAGYHSVDEARRLGDLAVREESGADRLAALFPPRTVSLRTYF